MLATGSQRGLEQRGLLETPGGRVGQKPFLRQTQRAQEVAGAARRRWANVSGQTTAGGGQGHPQRHAGQGSGNKAYIRAKSHGGAGRVGSGRGYAGGTACEALWRRGNAARSKQIYVAKRQRACRLAKICGRPAGHGCDGLRPRPIMTWKYEIRMSKSETISKPEISRKETSGFWSLGILHFRFVSYFELRISDFHP